MCPSHRAAVSLQGNWLANAFQVHLPAPPLSKASHHQAMKVPITELSWARIIFLQFNYLQHLAQCEKTELKLQIVPADTDLFFIGFKCFLTDGFF